MNRRVPQTGPRRPVADVAVIGGGIAGLLAAWRAAETGADVVVVDDADRRPPASAVAAGMIAPVGEAIWGEERLLGAALAAAAEWPRFAERLSAGAARPVPYRRCGSVHVSLDRDEAAELDRRVDLHRRHDLRSERLLGSECRRLEPALSTAVVAGLSAPQEAEVDPRALLTALRAAAAAAGVRFEADRAAHIDPLAGTVDRLENGQLSAGTVVLAAGAWSGFEELVEGIRAPVRPVKGEILRLRADPGRRVCERIVVGERFYLVPRESGELVLGATVSERGFDLRVSAGGVHELLREAYRALPELAELELVEAGAGLRPGSPDNAPIFGRHRDSRLILATGLYRNGILLAPLIAAGLDALLAGDPEPPELAGLGLDRFAAPSREPRP
jgi:glycine oxidase